MELQPDDGPRPSLGIGPGSDDVVGPRREFVRRFVEGIRKLAGNMLGDHQKIPEASRLAGRRLDRSYPGNRAAANDCQWLNCLGPMGKSLVPSFQAIDGRVWSSPKEDR
ncbi:hypothetical protein BHE74_00058208 [Ensete ventricosum]|uniref:Uncharacterized protein n=1 Tax=Ensete ventricosum TaxID=4639 RepID=A0A445MH08_ENSVE|nr:hypothetical protein BHE74_00058208 [Ensete ventricosum]RZR73481.1 hypothetical protein BHM03_00024805 [Ensete ventricosum]